MKTTNQRILAGILILFILVALPGIAEVLEGDIQKTFQVKEKGWLTLTSDLGSIEVRTHDQKEVRVEIDFEPRRNLRNRELKEILQDMDVDFRENNGNVDVRLEYMGGSRSLWDSIGRYVRVSFYITIPEVYNVNLKTSGGSIEVDDLIGEILAQTSGGSLKFGRIQGPVRGRTSGGSITMKACKGNADIKTSGGSIHLGWVEGDVEARTSGGGISVEEVMGTIEASTSGGSIEATISEPPHHDCRLTTSGGSITVYLDRDAALNLNAKTSGGRVSTDFPVMVQGVISKRSLQAEINGGGPELYLKTSGGSIYIRKQ